MITLAFGALLWPRSALAGNNLVAGDMVTEPTINSIGIRWFITGDDDRDARVTLLYRRSGTISYNLAQNPLRLDPVQTGNLFAGSILYLVEDTTYELKMYVVDPDGGFSARVAFVRTRSTPGDPAYPRVRYVTPGNGGGSGTAQDPFRGIGAANAAAQPGDLFLLRAGTYTGTSTISRSGTAPNPIVWRAEVPGAAVLDGQWTAKPLLNLPSVRHVHIEDLVIRNPRRYAVLSSATEGLVIRGCRIEVPDVPGEEMGGIYLLGAGHRFGLIEDNVIIGPCDWQDGRNDDSYAVRIQGIGHIVRRNDILNWWDGTNVGVDDPSVETSDCDVYQNEIHNCTDDGIETDGSYHNIRVYQNRITNVLSGLSAQPVYGGPVYMMHNVVYNWQLKSLKFHQNPTGIVVVHNTFVGADPRGWGGGDWENCAIWNNLFLGSSQGGPTGPPVCLETNGQRARMSTNGWRQVDPARFAEWNGSLYRTLTDFQARTGLEAGSRLLDLTTFVAVEEPPLGSYMGEDGFPPPYDPASQDPRLRAGSTAIDAGTVLRNIDDGYAGARPDLGAYEYGRPIPEYGPAGGGLDALAAVEGARVAADPPLRLSAGSLFRERVILRFGVGGEGPVRLSVHDVEGRRVRLLMSGAALSPGDHELLWDGSDDQGRPCGRGVYFVRIETGSGSAAGKVIRID